MTATSLLDRVPVEEIAERAHAARFGRSVATLIAGLLFGSAWLVSKTLAVIWLGVAWCATAARLGWREARGDQPSRATLREENTRLREHVKRLGG